MVIVIPPFSVVGEHCTTEKVGMEVAELKKVEESAKDKVHLTDGQYPLVTGYHPSVTGLNYIPVRCNKKMERPDGLSIFLVPVTGLEPVRCRHRWILSPLRLPFHHTGRCENSIVYFFKKSKRKVLRMQ